jgi:hypothetical protein
MGMEYIMNRGEERFIQGIGWGNLRERNNLEDRGVDGNIILRWNCSKWYVGA